MASGAAVASRAADRGGTILANGAARADLLGFRPWSPLFWMTVASFVVVYLAIVERGRP